MVRNRNRQSSYSTPSSAAMAVRESCGSCGIAIGQCGCNGGGAPVSYARPTPSMPMPMPGASGTGNPARDAWAAGCRMNDGCYPREWYPNAQRTFADVLRGELFDAAQGQAPYLDPIWDFNHMDTLYSTLVVGPGATETLEVQPVQGTFTMFYYTLIARDPATGALQDAWTYQQPAVANCPTRCAQADVDIPSQFANRMPTGCCGIPKIAFLAKPSDDAPLQVSVTNDQVSGDLEFTIEVRGYCCSTRVC